MVQRWFSRIDELIEEVRSSGVPEWRRQDIERLFNVKRSTAQQIMTAIGYVQPLKTTGCRIAAEGLTKFLNQFRMILGAGDKNQDPEAIRRAQALFQARCRSGSPQSNQLGKSHAQGTCRSKILVIEIDEELDSKLKYAASQFSESCEEFARDILPNRLKRGSEHNRHRPRADEKGLFTPL
jgi:plasmid stability protein